MDTIKSDELVEHALSMANNSLSGRMGKADIYILKAGMAPPVDDVFRTEIEGVVDARKPKAPPPDKAVILVETAGGVIETVERIVQVLRKHYTTVEFIIPSYAYSAGTILVMSGDEIYMDYYAVLGPIDPQYPSDDGNYVPGMGYLAKFRELVDRINTTHDANGNQLPDPRAEVAFLIKRFDPAKLFDIEQAVEHAKSLLRDWLPKYKFKDWTKSSSGATIGPKEREERAEKIANVLGDTQRWHSHGRGITIRELASDEIKLKIKDFGLDPEFSADVRHYHGLFVDYLQKRGWKGAIHSGRGIRRVQ